MPAHRLMRVGDLRTHCRARFVRHRPRKLICPLNTIRIDRAACHGTCAPRANVSRTVGSALKEEPTREPAGQFPRAT
jgi:hypothetical protein